MINILLRVPEDRIPLFIQLPAYGIIHSIETGMNLRDVLVGQIGIDPIYLDTQIQTIFVDGKAVDMIEDEFVRDGCVIALSSAMPGLVGAVFRKNGMFKSLRSAITPIKRPENLSAGTGSITLKLFNRVAADIGPGFLHNGIQVKGDHLKRFFDRHINDIVSACSYMEIDGQKKKITNDMSRGWEGSDVKLTVISL